MNVCLLSWSLALFGCLLSVGSLLVSLFACLVVCYGCLLCVRIVLFIACLVG